MAWLIVVDVVRTAGRLARQAHSDLAERHLIRSLGQPVTRSHKAWIFGAGLCALGFGSFEARDWYYRRYVWPSEIQHQLLGGLLARGRALTEYEGYAHYGQGMFHWRYKVERDSTLLAALCAGHQIDTCTFTKSRTPSADVSQVIAYANGVLTVEEGWN